LTIAGSKPEHAFPETGGFQRTEEDTKPAATEFMRIREELGGHARIRFRQGSRP